MSDFDNGERYSWVETGDIWEISMPPIQFCCKSKIALKKKLFFFFKPPTYKRKSPCADSGKMNAQSENTSSLHARLIGKGLGIELVPKDREW